MKRSAFTLIELMVVVLIIGLLIAILLPSLAEAMEAGKRAQCASNLRGMANVINIYKSQSNDSWPSLERGKKFDGTALSDTAAIDTNNSLWLLVMNKNSPEMFICPSDRGAVAFKGTPEVDNSFPKVKADGTADTSGTKRCYSYSYQVPVGNVGNPGTAQGNATKFAVMSDRAPFNADLELPADASVGDTTPAADARKWLRDNPNLAVKVNSPNHAGKGQNVLFQDGHCKWQADPWCGIDDDNIFTRASGDTEKTRVIGTKCGTNQLPYSDNDSVLLNIDKGVFCTDPGGDTTTGS